jgi:hypothetical protein
MSAKLLCKHLASIILSQAVDLFVVFTIQTIIGMHKRKDLYHRLQTI